MNKPDFEKVLNEDVPQAPPWFKNVLEPLNRLFEYIKDAFDGNISTENLKVQVITYSFIAPYSTTSFKKTKNGRIISCVLGQIRTSNNGPLGGVTSIDWFDNGSQLVVDGLYSLGSGGYTATFVAQYE